MLELIKDTNIDFMGRRRWAIAFSATLVVLSLLLIIFRGLNWGLDFTGGTQIEVSYPKPIDIPVVRQALAKAGFDRAETQHFGTASDVLIRIPPHGELSSAELSDHVLNALQKADPKVQMRRVEFIGPQVGSELVEKGSLALLYSLIGILIYVTLRFEWRLALGTIIALAHDALITVGVFSLFQLQFDLTVLAAVLAVIGYSVNDSVVVLDRIRENFRKMRKGRVDEIVNAAINQTLTRTLFTSGTTLLAIVALLVLGGPVIRNFALAMLVGVGFGTYSSVYVASAGAVELGLRREDLALKPKAEADERP